MQTLLKQLAQRKPIGRQACYDALTTLTKAKPEQAAAFLSLLHAKSETSDELQGFLDYLQPKMQRVHCSQPTLDIVGTGGDGQDTVNISSAASLVCASLGVSIAKHGNRSVSSRCGSADIMEALGIPIDLSTADAQQLLEKTGFVFLYAPHFHPALAPFKALREALGIPTAFNLLGPLLNPTRPDYLLLGVYQPQLMSVYADLLRSLAVKRALIVHSQGLDEASLLGETQLLEINRGKQQYHRLHPADFGLKTCCLKDIQGGDACFNKARIYHALHGEKSALTNTIALNAGCGLYASFHCESIRDGVKLAQQQLHSGKVMETLQHIIATSRSDA